MELEESLNTYSLGIQVLIHPSACPLLSRRVYLHVSQSPVSTGPKSVFLVFYVLCFMFFTYFLKSSEIRNKWECRRRNCMEGMEGMEEWPLGIVNL